MLANKNNINVLFVCLGNICRSPTAHGVFEKLVEDASLNKHIYVDSAGTAAYHVGNKPDSRSSKTALSRGYDLSHLRARQVESPDFNKFHYLLAMDEENLLNLQDICPEPHQQKLQLFLEYGAMGESYVPDPYYGGESGFDYVLDLVEDASRGLLDHIKKTHF